MRRAKRAANAALGLHAWASVGATRATRATGLSQDEQSLPPRAEGDDRSLEAVGVGVHAVGEAHHFYLDRRKTQQYEVIAVRSSREERLQPWLPQRAAHAHVIHDMRAREQRRKRTWPCPPPST